MMMKKMTLRGKITILTIGLVIVVGVIAGYFLLRDPLVFKEKETAAGPLFLHSYGKDKNK